MNAVLVKNPAENTYKGMDKLKFTKFELSLSQNQRHKRFSACLPNIVECHKSILQLVSSRQDR